MEFHPDDIVYVEPTLRERRVRPRRQVTIPAGDWESVVDPETGGKTGELVTTISVNKTVVELVIAPLGRAPAPTHVVLPGEPPEFNLRGRWYRIVGIRAG